MLQSQLNGSLDLHLHDDLTRFHGYCRRPYCGQPLSALDANGYCFTCALIDSPIEVRYLDAWREVRPDINPLQLFTRQFPARARGHQAWVDFGLQLTPRVILLIELDGFNSHSKPGDITHDRQRQRDLEDQGKQVRRYGGAEIYHDAQACVQDTIWWIRRKARENGLAVVGDG